MRSFSYECPSTLKEAFRLLSAPDEAARPLAGGTDLIIRLRDGSIRADTVVDVKRIPDLRPRIEVEGEHMTIGATTVMTDVAASDLVRHHFLALAEAALVVGSVQIRNRATLAGNVCNASPAADTATSLLAFGAVVVLAGNDGTRRLSLDDFFVRSGMTTMRPGELLTSIEIPLPRSGTGSVHLRRTRRRGHDLAAVTMSCVIDGDGATRLAYGSVGPRPVVFADDSGTLADPTASDEDRSAVLSGMLAAASPSPTSMRAAPDYRLAMLNLLGRRAVTIALERTSRT
ncbi:MAG: xanthine dehydrogenase family protein subunit M [Chloroflexota bacterium]